MALVKLDLMELKAMHPLLPAKTAAEYAHRAAIGLERHRHVPGVVLKTRFDREKRDASLHWTTAEPGAEDQLDAIRVTEDAAEAVTLAFVHAARGWVIRRRLQRGEAADWLLRAPDDRLVALEVSGIGEGRDTRRMRKKLEQVAGAKIGDHRAACVVELPVPRATVENVRGAA